MGVYSSDTATVYLRQVVYPPRPRATRKRRYGRQIHEKKTARHEYFFSWLPLETVVGRKLTRGGLFSWPRKPK